MVSRNLVICDQEERYAAALAHFFMKTKELALGVQVCNSVAQALRLQEESPIDISSDRQRLSKGRAAKSTGRKCVCSDTIGRRGT